MFTINYFIRLFVIINLKMGNKPGQHIIYKRGQDCLSTPHHSLYEIKATDITGHELLLGDLLDSKKCTLIVNVASRCVLAKQQYLDIIETYKQYRDYGFEVLVFPCNQF